MANRHCSHNLGQREVLGEQSRKETHMKYSELNLGQIEAIVNKLGGMDGVQRFLAGTSEVIAKGLLERLATTITIPVVASFTAKDFFVIDTSKKAAVKIGWLGENFKKKFLPKVEKNEVPAEELAPNKLLERAYDPAIITALGGEAKVEITLGQFFAAFAKQPNGEAGALLTNGYANVGYIRDIEGVLWAVSGFWDDFGWRFGASPLDDPDRWDDGGQFLSR